MRFHLEANVVLVVKADHAGVVFKDADTPIGRPQSAADFLGRGKNRLFQQVVDEPALKIDRAFQSLVRTVLRPCLRQGFQLDVSGITAKGAVMPLNG